MHDLDRPVVMATLGTHGDMRPLVALGRGLQERGRRVRVLTSANFEPFIRANGLEFFPLTGDHQVLLRDNPNVAERGNEMWAMARIFRDEITAWSRDWAEQGRVACEGAGMVIGTGSASILAATLGESFDIPVVFAQLQPLTVTRELPPISMPASRMPGWTSVLLQHLMRAMGWQLLRPAMNRVVRPQLGLPAYPWFGPPRGGIRVLYGYSPQLSPRPGDWPQNAQVCGYWPLPQPQWTPPEPLCRFLEDGPTPLYIGFGSMTAADAEGLTAMIKQAVTRTGHRALLASGWGGLAGEAGKDDAGRFFHLEHAPHDWLFPRVAAAMHHGGCGTTGAAVTAGIPSVILPFGYDQPFWAHCLAECGAAPRALSRKTLTADIVANALESATSMQMRMQAAELGERVRAEDGIAMALQWLERWQLLAPSARPVVRELAEA